MEQYMLQEEVEKLAEKEAACWIQPVEATTS